MDTKELWEQKVPTFYEKEQTEYEKFVQKMLDKEEKSLEDMTDKETEEFWNKVDKKWNSDDEEGEDGRTKKEELSEEDKSRERVSSCVEKKMNETDEDWTQEKAVAACLAMEEEGELNEKGEYVSKKKKDKDKE